MESQTAEREDEGISKLPDPILQHILSFLSQEEAVRTCVLSKSWRYLGSTRPRFCLKESYFGEDNKEKFMNVLNKSLQVYSDQKPCCIEDFSVTSESTVDPELVSLLEKWIPILIHDFGVKKFHLSFSLRIRVIFFVPSAVFESKSLQELYLQNCNLSQIKINSIGNNHHLKTLILQDVSIEDESFAKFLSSCSSIEHLSLRSCKGLRTINMHDYHNLKSFELSVLNNNIYLPSIVGYLFFPGLTCLRLVNVPLSKEWFDSLSRNYFPCLEELQLKRYNGFDELKLSSRSIKNLDITMDKSMSKATIDAPSIKEFRYSANVSQSISFTTTSSSNWKSRLHLRLDIDSSLWFRKLSELVAAFSQSQINSLVLFHFGGMNHEHIEHLSDFSSVCCGDSYKVPVAIESLSLALLGLYYDSFYSDLVNGLFRIIRSREIKLIWYVDANPDSSRKIKKVAEFLCRTLQMGRWEDEGMRSYWQHDLEEVSLEVKNGHFEEWHPVEGTINWSEYVATLLPLGNKISSCLLRFRLKWRKNSF